MQPEFWKARWSEGKIGFHEGAPNTLLTAHRTRIADRKRILVPLCGKTEDLAYLAAQGHEVIGIELVEDAVRAFFSEHGVEPEIAGNRFVAGEITIHAGDVFAVQDVGVIDAIYDRAALIALPPDLRARYIAHLKGLVPATTPVLLVTLEYPQDQFGGPPFSVPEAEVREHYTSVELIETRAATGGRIAESGLAAFERCYLATL